jgi:hypothetical protein
MRPALSVVKHDRAKSKRIAFVPFLAFFLMPVAWSRVADPNPRSSV